MINGTRVTPSYTNNPCVRSPCAQALSVIADEDDEGALEQVASLEEAEHATDLRVHEYDGALIPARPIRPAVGRVVGRVRVVEVQPSKELGP